MIDSALKYVERGWRVLPLHWILEDGGCSCRKACESPGKHPFSKLAPNGSHSATANPQVVRDWWGMLPRLNVGIATGEDSGLVVLDVDPRHGGTETVESLLETHGDFTRTLWAVTGSGGHHYYFRHPGYPVRNSAGAVGPGVDVRGEGGYVVAPPSVHVSGVYKWAFDDDSGEISAMPGWIAAKDNRQSTAPVLIEGMIAKGEQHHALVSIAGTVRKRGCTEAEIYALVSQVNRRCQEPGSDSNIRKIAQSVAQYTPDEVLGALDDLEAEIAGGAPFASLAELVSEAIEKADAAKKAGGKLPGLSYGFEKLDDMLLGAQPSELVVIAARPSMGKTALAVQLAATFARQKAGAIFSIEMAGLAIANRFLSARAELDSLQIRSGRLTDGEFESLVRAGSELASLPIEINDDSSITTKRMKSILPSVDGLGWVIVDYLQFVQVVEKGSNREADVAAISRDLKGIAKRFNVPVIALAQLSRKNEGRSNKRPMLSDLRESGQIEQDADAVLFIHRADKYGETHIECGGATVPSDGLAEIIISKQRNGPIGDVVLTFDEKFARFSEYDRVTHMPRTNSHDNLPF